MKIEEVFKHGLTISETDAEYRTKGKYHSSDLCSVYLGEQFKLDPEVKAQISEDIGNQQNVINGHAFEDYMEDKNKLQFNWNCRTTDRPTGQLGDLCDVLIEKKVSPDDIASVRRIMDTMGLWKSSKSDNARNKLATLAPESKIYINEGIGFRTIDRKTVINSQTRQSIIESSSRLHTKYPWLLEPAEHVFYDYQTELVWEDIAIKLDCIRVNVQRKTVDIIDFKFKGSDADQWVDSHYWKYGYWIQAVLYRHVVKQCLSDEFSLVSFYFVVGSNANPQSSCVVRHPSPVDALFNRSYTSEWGRTIPSIQTLMVSLDKMQAENRWDTKWSDLDTNGIAEPGYPPKLLEYAS